MRDTLWVEDVMWALRVRKTRKEFDKWEVNEHRNEVGYVCTVPVPLPYPPSPSPTFQPSPRLNDKCIRKAASINVLVVRSRD